MQDESFINRKPLSIKTLLIAGGVGFVAIFIGVAIFLIATAEPEQNLENEEPSLEYAGENSRLAGIQELLTLGLTAEQYTTLYSELNKYFDRTDPTATYFEYLPESLTFQKSTIEASGLSDEELAAILASLGENDATAEPFGPEGTQANSSSHDEKLQLPVVSFRLASNTGKEYTVKFDRSAAPFKIEVF